MDGKSDDFVDSDYYSVDFGCSEYFDYFDSFVHFDCSVDCSDVGYSVDPDGSIVVDVVAVAVVFVELFQASN